ASRVWNDNLDSSRSLRPRTGQSDENRKSASGNQIGRSAAGSFTMMSLKCIVSTAYQRPADGSRALPLRLRSWHAELYSNPFTSAPTGLSSGGRFGSPIRATVATCTSACLRSWWLSVRVSYYALPVRLDCRGPHQVNPGNCDRDAGRKLRKNH